MQTYGLTFHLTHYTSFLRWLYRSDNQTNSSTEGQWL